MLRWSAIALLVLTACDEPTAVPSSSPAPPATTPAAPATDATKLNVNTATDEQIATALPDLGSRMLHEIDEYKPYVSVTQFRHEIGKYVDDAAVEGYLAHLYIPVDPDNCDVATLAQLPGVTLAVGAALIGDRPFTDRDAFLTALSALVGEENAAAAPALLTAQ